MSVYDVDYFEGRKKKRQLVYRLQRRTDEVARAIAAHGDGRLQTLVDVGAADGLMLAKLRARLGAQVRLVGLDYSIGLLRAAQLPGVNKLQADAQALPLPAGAADVVVATAVIEHVPAPAQMMRECARVLRPGGLLIVTTPDPFMDKVATTLGILKETGHQFSFNLRQLREIFRSNGFAVAEAKKFMFSPVGFPFEKTIEKVFGPLGLRLVMANQIVVGRRP